MSHTVRGMGVEAAGRGSDLLGGSLEHPFVALPVFKALKCALAVSALLQSLLCHPASQLLLLHTP